MQTVRRQQVPVPAPAYSLCVSSTATQISACGMQEPDMKQQVEHKLHELGRLLRIRQDAVQVSCHLPPIVDSCKACLRRLLLLRAAAVPPA